MRDKNSIDQKTESGSEIISKPEKTSKETNIVHYLGIAICTCLIILGLYQTLTNKSDDGLLNIITGSSLLSLFVPFEYKSLSKWKQGLVIVYAIFILLVTFYLIYITFIRQG